MGAPRGVPGRPREHLECPQWHPGTSKRAPRDAPERAEATKTDAKSCSDVKKSSFYRAACPRSTVEVIFRRILLIFGVFPKFEKLIPCGPGRTEQGSALVEKDRVAHAKEVRKSSKIEAKIYRKSLGNSSLDAKLALERRFRGPLDGC